MDFLTQQFIAFARDIRIRLNRLENLLQQQNEAIERAAHAQQQQHQPPPNINAELHIPQAVEDAHSREHEQNRRLQIASIIVAGLAALFTAGAFAAAAYYAYWAKLTYFEIGKQTPKIAESADAASKGANAAKEAADTSRDQFDLYKRQIIAVISFSYAEPTEPRMKTEIALHFANNGHVVSDPTRVNVEIFHTNADGNKIISKSQRYSFMIPSLKPPQGQIPDTFTWKHSLGYQLPNRFRDDGTVRIEGTILGTDGFGHRIPTSFCVSYVPYAHIQLEHEAAGVEQVGDLFTDCKDYADRVTKIRKYGLADDY